MQAGANIFDPVNFEQQVHNISADDDVNQSLMELLSRNPAKSNRVSHRLKTLVLLAGWIC